MKPAISLRLLPIVLLLALSPRAGAVGVSFGTLAITSEIEFCFLTTPSTCPPISNIDGGAGIDLATSQYEVSTTSGDVIVAEASAVYDDANVYTPSLGVYVNNQSGLVFTSLASASGIQAYSNTTDESLSISLDILLSIADQSPGATLDANVVVYRTDEIDIVGDPDDFSSVEFDIGNLDQIVSYELPARDPTVFPPPPYPGLIEENFDFVIGPQEDFLIWASLSALATEGGLIDARNTLGFGLTVNNPGLDTSSLAIASQTPSAIPLPAGVWLFLTGIGLVGGLARWRPGAS